MMIYPHNLQTTIINFTSLPMMALVASFGISDGSYAGTTPAPGNHEVLVGADKLETNFPILNNVLYIPERKHPKETVYINMMHRMRQGL
jgi:hypothetical protein